MFKYINEKGIYISIKKVIIPLLKLNAHFTYKSYTKILSNFIFTYSHCIYTLKHDFNY